MRNSFRGLIEKLALIMEKEFIRFLIVGGANTVIGYAVTMYLYKILHIDYKVSLMLNFIFCFPIAYSLQALYAFRTKWTFKRLILYPISSLPNYLMQFVSLLISVEVFNIPADYSYIISYIVPIPIMFFIVRFIVKPFQRKSDTLE